MLRSSLLQLAGLFISAVVFAQSSVTGTVINGQSRKPIEFASVELVRVTDTIVIKGTVTDKKGRFEIAEITPGNYFIRSSFIGYNNNESVHFSVVPDKKEIAVGQMELLMLSDTMTAVTVTGTRARLNTGIDRKVYNVDQDIMSRSGSAADILRNVPSIEVDVEGNVALRGSGDVMILINGKPNPLMGRTRAEVLQQLPANSIERIEVITNPSARYRPDGTGGIINIVLKKNIRNGFNGTATANAGNRDRYNGNINLNYRPKNLNLFGSYSFRHDTRKRYNTIDRTILDSFTLDVKSYYNQATNSITRPRSHIVSGGVDYTINDKNSIGASGTYYSRDQLRKDIASNSNFDNNHNLTGAYDRYRYAPEFERQKSGTFYFQHDFSKEDHELRFELNLSNEKEEEDNQYTNSYRVPPAPITMDNTLIQVGTRENQFTVDYANAFSNDSKLELGYDGLYNREDLNYYGEYYDTLLGDFVKNEVTSNRFIYKEDVHAFYGTYQRAFEKFSYEFGLRAEGVLTTSNQVDKDSIIDNNYFKLYPTLHLSYQLKENTEVQLNYSKRVNRPDADELNPFPEYQDPRNLRTGNPKLLPETIHSIELGLKWQNKNFSFVPSIYYRYKSNAFTTVTIPIDDSTLLTTEQNLSNDQSAGLELIFSAKAGKVFNATLSTNLFYNRINADNLGYIQNKSLFSGSGSLVGSFLIAKGSMLQVSSNYRSARQTPQGRSYPTFVLNSGFRQDLAKNKLSITLTASDILKSLRQKTELNTLYMKQVSINRRDGLVVFLGMSYRFGIVKKEEKLQYDDGL